MMHLLTSPSPRFLIKGWRKMNGSIFITLITHLTQDNRTLSHRESWHIKPIKTDFDPRFLFNEPPFSSAAITPAMRCLLRASFKTKPSCPCGMFCDAWPKMCRRWLAIILQAKKYACARSVTLCQGFCLGRVELVSRDDRCEWGRAFMPQEVDVKYITNDSQLLLITIVLECFCESHCSQSEQSLTDNNSFHINKVLLFVVYTCLFSLLLLCNDIKLKFWIMWEVYDIIWINRKVCVWGGGLTTNSMI